MKNSTLNWVDCKVLTKLMCDCIQEMTSYAQRGYEENGLYGDSNVQISLINLQKRIEAVRAKSIAAGN